MTETEAAHAAAEKTYAAQLQRAAADRRGRLAWLAGEVNAMRSRTAARRRGRTPRRRPDEARRPPNGRRRFAALDQIAGLDAGEEGLDAEHEAAARPSTTSRGGGQGSRRGAPGARLVGPDAPRSAGKDGRPRCWRHPSGSAGLLGSGGRPCCRVRTGYGAGRRALGSAADAVAVTDAEGRGHRDRSPKGATPTWGWPVARGHRRRLGTAATSPTCATSGVTPSTSSEPALRPVVHFARKVAKSSTSDAARTVVDAS